MLTTILKERLCGTFRKGHTIGMLQLPPLAFSVRQTDGDGIKQTIYTESTETLKLT